MTNHSVSVVLITHNRDVSFLDRSLKSILKQSLKPKEIVVVDAGCDDHRELTKRYLSTVANSNIFLVGRNNMSAPEARNFGAACCSGDYLAFLDDDDEWYNDKLETQLLSSVTDPVIIHSPYYVENNGSFIQFNNGIGYYPDILSRNSIGCTSFPLIKKSAFDDIGGFDLLFESNQEWDLFIRLMVNNNISFCNSIAGVKHITTGITTDVDKRLSGWKTLLSKHKKEYYEFPVQYKNAIGTFCREMIDKRSLRGITVALLYKIKVSLL